MKILYPQVKDKNEYKFEPAKIVRKICAIYVHLGSSDKFCAAVSRDGRSYSPQLFEQAASVLGLYTTSRLGLFSNYTYMYTLILLVDFPCVWKTGNCESDIRYVTG